MKGLVITPEITTSKTRNPPEEWNFAENYRFPIEESFRGIEFLMELPDFGRGIHRENGIPPGITGSWLRNLQMVWNSAGITSSWTQIQTGKIKTLPNSDYTKVSNSKESLSPKPTV
jgi:hypothetical protein